jgi:hypothetical protein
MIKLEWGCLVRAERSWRLAFSPISHAVKW